MACAFDRARLSAYVDDALEGDERGLVDRHLAECAECREVLAGLRQAVAALRSLPPVAPPADFATGLRARLLANAPCTPGPVGDALAGARVISLARPPDRGAGSRRSGPGAWSRAWPAAAAAVLALAVGWGSAWTMAGGRISLNGIQTPAAAAAADRHGANAGGPVGQAARGAPSESAQRGPASVGQANGTKAPSGPPPDQNQDQVVGASESGSGFASPFLSSNLVASAPVPERPPIARSAEVRIEVNNLAAGYALTLQHVAAVQAEIVTSSYAGRDAAGATLDIRVPSDRLDALLASLSQVGTLVASQVKGEDMSARLRALDESSRQLASGGPGGPDQPLKGAASTGTADGSPNAGFDGTSAADQLQQIRDQENEINQRVNWATLTVTLTSP